MPDARGVQVPEHPEFLRADVPAVEEGLDDHGYGTFQGVRSCQPVPLVAALMAQP